MAPTALLSWMLPPDCRASSPSVSWLRERCAPGLLRTLGKERCTAELARLAEADRTAPSMPWPGPDKSWPDTEDRAAVLACCHASDAAWPSIEEACACGFVPRVEHVWLCAEEARRIRSPEALGRLSRLAAASWSVNGGAAPLGFWQPWFALAKSVADGGAGLSSLRRISRMAAFERWELARQAVEPMPEADAGASFGRCLELASAGLMGSPEESSDGLLAALLHLDPNPSEALFALARRRSLCASWGREPTAAACSRVARGRSGPELAVCRDPCGESLLASTARRRNWWMLLWLFEEGVSPEADADGDTLEVWKRALFHSGDEGADTCVEFARGWLAVREMGRLMEEGSESGSASGSAGRRIL